MGGVSSCEVGSPGRPDSLALPRHGGARPRRDGSRVSGRGPPSGPTRGAQVPARCHSPGRRGPRPLPARGACRLGAEPPPHLHDPRHRRAGRPAVHRHGAARGADAPAADRGEAPRPRRPARRGDAGRRGAGGGPRPGHRPPRHQGREHLPHRGGRGEGPRLRAGEARHGPPWPGRRSDVRADGRRPRGTDYGAGPGGGHRGLHVAGAGARRGGRCPHRRLLLRGRPLRAGYRQPAVRGRYGRRPLRRHPQPAADPGLPAEPRPAGRARPHPRQGAGEGPGAAVPERPRAAGGPRPPEARQRLAALDRRRCRRDRARVVAQGPTPAGLRGNRRSRAACSPSLATGPGRAAALPRGSRSRARRARSSG